MVHRESIFNPGNGNVHKVVLAGELEIVNVEGSAQSFQCLRVTVPLKRSPGENFQIGKTDVIFFFLNLVRQNLHRKSNNTTDRIETKM